MAGVVRDLSQLIGKGGALETTCRGCGKVSIFDVSEVVHYWHYRKWTTAWPAFAAHMACSDCGKVRPKVDWLVTPPPPPTPEPPRPRFARPGKPKMPVATNVIDFETRRLRKRA